jgi:hypothetical protein
MSYESFTKKQAAFPQYKRLCDRTIRVTMDGKMLAPRRSKHEYHYRLLDDLLEILQIENDRSPSPLSFSYSLIFHQLSSTAFLV